MAVRLTQIARNGTVCHAGSRCIAARLSPTNPAQARSTQADRDRRKPRRSQVGTSRPRRDLRTRSSQPGSRSAPPSADSMSPSGSQPEEPYWTGTEMVPVLAQMLEAGASRQSVSFTPLVTVSASRPPAGPNARVAVPAGRAGSERQEDPGPLIAAARPPPRITDMAPPTPNADDGIVAELRRSGADRVQCVPPPVVQAARRTPVLPFPAMSRAALPAGVLVSLSTSVAWPASDAGRAGPAACHVPPDPVNMPATPERAQVPAASGAPDGVKETAVS